jgi:hypothetical protein
VLIDREQGGAERLAARGYILRAVVRINECFDELDRAGVVEAGALRASREFLRATRLP